MDNYPHFATGGIGPLVLSHEDFMPIEVETSATQYFLFNIDTEDKTNIGVYGTVGECFDAWRIYVEEHPYDYDYATIETIKDGKLEEFLIWYGEREGKIVLSKWRKVSL